MSLCVTSLPTARRSSPFIRFLLYAQYNACIASFAAILHFGRGAVVGAPSSHRMGTRPLNTCLSEIIHMPSLMNVLGVCLVNDVLTLSPAELYLPVSRCAALQSGKMSVDTRHVGPAVLNQDAV